MKLILTYLPDLSVSCVIYTKYFINLISTEYVTEIIEVTGIINVKCHHQHVYRLILLIPFLYFEHLLTFLTTNNTFSKNRMFYKYFDLSYL